MSAREVHVERMQTAASRDSWVTSGHRRSNVAASQTLPGPYVWQLIGGAAQGQKVCHLIEISWILRTRWRILDPGAPHLRTFSGLSISLWKNDGITDAGYLCNAEGCIYKAVYTRCRSCTPTLCSLRASYWPALCPNGRSGLSGRAHDDLDLTWHSWASRVLFQKCAERLYSAGLEASILS
jgi:hypothetical protein